MLTLAIAMPGGFEWIIVMGIGLLLFGKRLPEVGRSLGKGIVEFKKGLKGVEDDITQVDDHLPTAPRPQITAPAATPVVTAVATEHKFDPFTGKPLGTEASVSPSEVSHPVEESHTEVSSTHP